MLEPLREKQLYMSTDCRHIAMLVTMKKMVDYDSDIVTFGIYSS